MLIVDEKDFERLTQAMLLPVILGKRSYPYDLIDLGLVFEHSRGRVGSIRKIRPLPPKPLTAIYKGIRGIVRP